MTWAKAIWGSSFQRRCIQVVITIPQINIDRAISQVFYEFPTKTRLFYAMFYVNLVDGCGW